MDALEGSTLELMHRRRVRSFYAGYAMILMASGMIAALPLVKVDVVCNAPGMIRPGEEPVEVISPITGVVESTLLKDFKKVEAGDTLLWFSRRTPDARISEYRQMIRHNHASILDITSILHGEWPKETSLYQNSHRNYQSQQTLLDIEKEFLHSEYLTAETLFRQEVIPVREYERARSQYKAASAGMDEHRESYRSRLSEKLSQLQKENRRYQGEITQITASFQNFCIIAPSSGILQQCRGGSGGSVLATGTRLGTICPESELVAECYIETRDIPDIIPGMPVRIRFDRRNHGSVSCLYTEVSHIDPDVLMINNRLVYRVQCAIGFPASGEKTSLNLAVIPGMTFSANLVLHRVSLASLLVEKLNRRINPGLVAGQ